MRLPKQPKTCNLHRLASGAEALTPGLLQLEPSFQQVDNAELNLHVANSGEMTFISLDTERDVDELVKRMDIFHRTGTVTLVYDVEPLFFENSCRWMAGQACKLPLLRRLTIDSEMNIHSCRDASLVGTIGDSYDKMVAKVRIHQQSQAIQRECSTCAIRDNCSQCAQLPESLGGRYCEIRKSYPLLVLYVEILSLAHMVFQALGSNAKNNVNFRISCRGLPLQHYRGPVGIPQPGLQPVIFETSGQYFLLQRGVPKLLRLSEPLAMMTEARWAGASDDAITESLAEQFQVSVESARLSLVQGTEKLRASGCI